jgi:serine/threonine-protein kinase
VLPRLQQALYGEFVISRELGRGGMAAVFLAHQLRLDRKVAIKVMAPSLLAGMGLVERFREEATTVARLDHPNIISIYEIGSTADLQYFVMQYVRGRSLERATRQHGRLAFDVVRAIVFDVGRALAHAHRNQVIHRDVKPGNILLGLDGRVFVSDFGIAKVTASTVRTQTGAVVGTPSYMSPEQCFGRQLTWSADQYSLGVVAYEMVTGAPPFTGSPYAVMRGHTEDPLPPVATKRPDCPSNIAAAIERMLAKNPADRFESMGEALTAMGATRALIDESVQEAIGRLAIPMPDEQGVILVDTPASPAPPHEPSSPRVAAPAASTDASPESTLASRGRALARAALAKAKTVAQRARVFTARSVHNAGTFLRLLHVLALGAARQAGETRLALGVVAGAIGVALIATAVIVLARKAMPEKPAAPDGSRSPASLGPAPVKPDSSPDTAAVALVDTTADSLAVDTLGGVTDTVPVRIVLRSTTTLAVGDSLQMVATVLDVNGNRLRGYRVSWRVSSPVAVIDSVTGWLRAQASGRVRVSARADTIVKSTFVTITERPRPTPVDESTQTPEKPPAVDEAAESEAIWDVLATFVRSVILAKNVESIRKVYQTPTSADAAARDSLIDEITANPRLSILPPGSSPKPRLSGTAAYARTKLTMRNARRKKGPEAEFWIEAELHRSGTAWNVIGFRIVPRGE